MAIGSSRDIQIHAAVTIMGNQNNVKVIGEADKEIAQFAVQLDAKFSPFTERQVGIAFEGLKQHCLSQMRRAGLLR